MSDSLDLSLDGVERRSLADFRARIRVSGEVV